MSGPDVAEKPGGKERKEGLCSTLFAFLVRSFLSAEEDAALETRQNNSFRFFCARKENSRPSFLEILLRQNVASQKRGGERRRIPELKSAKLKGLLDGSSENGKVWHSTVQEGKPP